MKGIFVDVLGVTQLAASVRTLNLSLHIKSLLFYQSILKVRQ
jgi:hypothetical protein